MNWRSHSNTFQNCDIIVSQNDSGMVVLDGTMKNLYQKYQRIIGDVYIKYWAPATQSEANNVSGISIPYPNETVAFQDTKNKGIVKVENDTFRFEMYRPHSYYINVGDRPVQPNVKFIFLDKKYRPFSSVYNVVI